MLRLDLQTTDLQHFAARYDQDLTFDVDDGRLIVVARGLSFHGLGSFTATARLGPIEAGKTGKLTLPFELVDIAGLKFGRNLVAKKLLAQLRRPDLPEVTVKKDKALVIDTAKLIARFARPFEGYRVVDASFLDEKTPAVQLVLSKPRSG